MVFIPSENEAENKGNGNTIHNLVKLAKMQQSPLNFGQGLAIGMQNKQAQQAGLEHTYGKENVRYNPDPNVNQFEIFDKDMADWRPIVGKDFDAPRLASMVGKGLVYGINAVPQTIEKVGGVATGGAAMPLAMAASGAQQGGLETVRQGIGNIINQATGTYTPEEIKSGKASPYNKQEILNETISGGSVPLIGAAVGKGLTKLAKLIPAAKEAENVAGKNTVQVVDALKGELGEHTLNDVAQNKYVRSKLNPLLPEQADAIAQKAGEGVKQLYDKDFKTIANKIYAEVPNDAKANVGEALLDQQNRLSQFMESATDTQKKGVDKLQNTFKEILRDTDQEGNLSLKKLQAHASDMWETAKKLEKSGNNVLASQYKQASGLLSGAKGTNEAAQIAGQKFADLKKVEEFLENSTRINTARGELRLADKIRSLGSSDAVREELNNIRGIMERNPELKPYTSVIDDIKLAHVAQDIKKAKEAKPIGILNRIPGLKAIAELNPMSSTYSKLSGLKKGVESGKILPNALQKEIPVNETPYFDIGKNITKANAYRSLFTKGDSPLKKLVTPQPISNAVKNIPTAIEKAGIRQMLPQEAMPQTELPKGIVSPMPTTADNLSKLTTVAQNFNIPMDKVSNIMYQGVPKVLKNGMTNLEALAKIKAARGIKQNPEITNQQGMG